MFQQLESMTYGLFIRIAMTLISLGGSEPSLFVDFPCTCPLMRKNQHCHYLIITEMDDKAGKISRQMSFFRNMTTVITS